MLAIIVHALYRAKVISLCPQGGKTVERTALTNRTLLSLRLRVSFDKTAEHHRPESQTFAVLIIHSMNAFGRLIMHFCSLQHQPSDCMRLIVDSLECLTLVVLLILSGLHLYGVLLDLIEGKHRTHAVGIIEQGLPAILRLIEGMLIKDFVIFDIFLVGATP